MRLGRIEHAPGDRQGDGGAIGREGIDHPRRESGHLLATDIRRRRGSHNEMGRAGRERNRNQYQTTDHHTPNVNPTRNQAALLFSMPVATVCILTSPSSFLRDGWPPHPSRAKHNNIFRSDPKLRSFRTIPGHDTRI